MKNASLELRYDRRIMFQLVNSNQELEAMCENYSDEALQELFLDVVITNSVYSNQYKAIYTANELRSEDVHLMKDTPIVAEIRTIVNKYGWEYFIQALEIFASKKCKEMKILKFRSEAKVWDNIADKIRPIKEKVQL